MHQHPRELYRQFFEITARIRRIVEALSNLSNEEKATMLQAQALFFIGEFPKLTIGELASKLCISLSSTAQLIDRLSKSEWITREADAKDRRITRLVLTKQGEKEIVKLQEEMFEKMSEVFAYMPEEDMRELIRIHKSLLERLGEAQRRGREAV